jgi:hypothetical protein
MIGDVSKTYEIYQVIANARNPDEDQLFLYESYPTRAEAVRAAKQDFKKGRWQVHEVTRKIIANSETAIRAIGHEE